MCAPHPPSLSLPPRAKGGGFQPASLLIATASLTLSDAPAQEGDQQRCWRFASPECKRATGTVRTAGGHFRGVPWLQRPDYTTLDAYAPMVYCLHFEVIGAIPIGHKLFRYRVRVWPCMGIAPVGEDAADASKGDGVQARRKRRRTSTSEGTTGLMQQEQRDATQDLRDYLRGRATARDEPTLSEQDVNARIDLPLSAAVDLTFQLALQPLRRPACYEDDPLQAGVTSGPPGEGCWMVDEVSRTDDDGGSGGMRSTPDGGGGGAERPLQQASSLQMSAFSQMARR